MGTRDCYFVLPPGPEWDRMWAWIAAHPVNKGLPDPLEAEDTETGECWQYMDTEQDEGSPPCWVHVFRHRYHPVLKRRMYLRCPAPRWTPPTDTDAPTPKETT